MKFCHEVPEICRGQVHGPRKERKRIIIIIIIILKENNNNKKWSKNNKSPNVSLGDLIILPTKNVVDRPKTKSAIALTKLILKICTFSIKNHDFTRKKQ
jgi:hypothetical protein